MFNYNKALQLGLTQQEIAIGLSDTYGFNYAQAIELGLTDDEIITELMARNGLSREAEPETPEPEAQAPEPVKTKTVEHDALFDFNMAPSAMREEWSAPDQPQSAYEEEVEITPDGSAMRGLKNATMGLGVTKDILGDNMESAARGMATMREYNEQNRGSEREQEFSEAFNSTEGWDKFSAVHEKVKERWEQAPDLATKLKGAYEDTKEFGGLVVRQLPNSAVPVSLGAAGGTLGFLSPVPGGTAGGMFAGYAAGNTLVEMPGIAMELAQAAGVDVNDQAAFAKFLYENRAEIINKSSIKGAFIAGVDTVTTLAGGRILSGPARKVAERTLLKMGVDMADNAAVKAATESAEFLAHVQADPIFKAATTGTRKLGRNLLVAASEPVSEAVGEYGGGGLALGDWSEDAMAQAAAEGFTAWGQSVAGFAGSKAYEATTAPFTPAKKAAGRAQLFNRIESELDEGTLTEEEVRQWHADGLLDGYEVTAEDLDRVVQGANQKTVDEVLAHQAEMDQRRVDILTGVKEEIDAGNESPESIIERLENGEFALDGISDNDIYAIIGEQYRPVEQTPEEQKRGEERAQQVEEFDEAFDEYEPELPTGAMPLQEDLARNRREVEDAAFASYYPDMPTSREEYEAQRAFIMRNPEDVYSTYSPELAQAIVVGKLPPPPWMHSPSTEIAQAEADDMYVEWLDQRLKALQYNRERNNTPDAQPAKPLTAAERKTLAQNAEWDELVRQYQEQGTGWIHTEPAEDKSQPFTMRPSEEVYSSYSPEVAEQAGRRQLPAPQQRTNRIAEEAANQPKGLPAPVDKGNFELTGRAEAEIDAEVKAILKTPKKDRTPEQVTALNRLTRERRYARAREEGARAAAARPTENAEGRTTLDQITSEITDLQARAAVAEDAAREAESMGRVNAASIERAKAANYRSRVVTLMDQRKALKNNTPDASVASAPTGVTPTTAQVPSVASTAPAAGGAMAVESVPEAPTTPKRGKKAAKKVQEADPPSVETVTAPVTKTEARTPEMSAEMSPEMSTETPEIAAEVASAAPEMSSEMSSEVSTPEKQEGQANVQRMVQFSMANTPEEYDAVVADMTAEEVDAFEESLGWADGETTFAEVRGALNRRRQAIRAARKQEPVAQRTAAFKAELAKVVSKGRANGIMALLKARAASAGTTVEQYLESRQLELVANSQAGTAAQRQANKGAFDMATWVREHRAVIHAFESADVSTIAHELAHLFRQDLVWADNSAMLELAEEWAGVKDGVWTEAQEEKFARAFERYLAEGKAPNEGLKKLFDAFKKWMIEIYRSIKGSDIDVKLTPQIRMVFDALLTEGYVRDAYDTTAPQDGDGDGMLNQGWEKWEPAVTATGTIKGAPPHIKTRADLNRMRREIRKFIKEGISGRFWYEDSAQSILDLMQGDVVAAEKFIQLIAIYSPQAKVDHNTTFAVRAWTQWKNGITKEKYKVTSRANDDRAINVLYNDIPFDGRKTNSFYLNLMHWIVQNYPDKVDSLQLDAELLSAIRAPVTVDMWMYRAFGYPNDAYSGADIKNSEGRNDSYAFVENECRRIADRLQKETKDEDGWTPHQVQAAVWTAMKSRYEDPGVKAATWARSLKAGLATIGKNGRPTPPTTADGKRKHRAIWRAEAMKLTSAQAEANALEYGASYSDFIKRGTSVVTWEAIPSQSLGLDIFSASPEVKRMFTRDAAQLITDENGVDLLASQLGVQLAFIREGSGAYEGNVNPNSLTHLLPNKESGEFTKEFSRAYARAIQFIYKQDTVPFFRPDNRVLLTQDGRKSVRFRLVKTSNGRTMSTFATQVEAEDALATRKSGEYHIEGGAMTSAVGVTFHDTLTDTQESAILNLLSQFGDGTMGFTRTAPNEILIVNFRNDATRMPYVRDDLFEAAVQDFLDTHGESLGVKEQGSLFVESEYGHKHNWQEDTDGRTLLQDQALSGRSPDLHSWLVDRRKAFDQLIEQYSGEQLKQREAEAGLLSQAGPADQRLAGEGDLRGGRAANGLPVRDDGRVGLAHFSRQEGLTEVDPAKHGTGIAGAESRRKQNDPDNWVDRTYYAVEGGGYRKEAGLGPHRYNTSLNPEQLYDAATDPERFMAQAREARQANPFADPTNVFERLIKDAGYQGYFTNRMGTVAAVFEKIAPDSYQHQPEQGLLFQAAGDTSSDNFKRWFAGSKVVDQNGGPLLMYHGTDAPAFDEFKPGQKSKRYTTFSETEVESTGFFFTTDRGDAEQYGGRVDSFYLAAKNPLLNPAEAAISSRSSAEEKAAHEKLWDDVEYILAPAMYGDQGGKYIDTDNGMSKVLVDEDGRWLDSVFKGGQLDWSLLDNPQVVSRMKERGYDSVQVYEPNDESGGSWFVTKSTQVKSATRNSGAYSETDGRFLFQERATGDLVEDLIEGESKEALEEIGVRVYNRGMHKLGDFTAAMEEELGALYDQYKGAKINKLFTDVRKKVAADKKSARVDALLEAAQKEMPLRNKKRYRDLIQAVMDTRMDIHQKEKIFIKYAKEKLPERFRGGEVLQFITRISGKGTPAGRQKALIEGLKLIDQTYDKVEAEQAVKKITTMVRSVKPKLKDKKLHGDGYTPDTFDVMRAIRKVVPMGRAAVAKKMEDILTKADSEGRDLSTELNPKGIDSLDKLSELQQYVLLQRFGALRHKKGVEAVKSLEWLETYLKQKKDEFLALEKHHRGKVKTLVNLFVAEVTNGKGVKSWAGEQLDAHDRQKSIWKKLKDMASNFDTGHLSLEMILDKITQEAGGLLSARTVRYFTKLLHDSTRRYDAGVIKYQAVLAAKAQEIYGLGATNAEKNKLQRILNNNGILRTKTGVIVKPAKVGPNGKYLKDSEGNYIYEEKGEELPLSQNQAYKLWQSLQDPAVLNSQRIHGLTEETIVQLENFIDKKVMEWAKWQLYEFYPEYYKSINAIYKRIFHVDLPLNSYYSPISREHDGSDVEELSLNGRSHLSSVVNNSLLSRSKSNARLILSDGDSVIQQHVVMMEHFKAWAVPMREIRGVFHNKDVMTAIRQKSTKFALDVVHKIIDDLARGGVDRATALGAMDRARNRVTTSMIGLSPKIMAIQMTAIPAYMLEVPVSAFIKGFFKGLATLATNPRKFVKVINDSTMMQNRYKVGWERDLILLNKKRSAAVLSGKSSLSDTFMATVKLGDMGAVYSGGFAVYDYHYNRNINVYKMSPEMAHTDALDRFEIATERTQQAGNVKDLSYFQTAGGSFGKLFTMFMTQPNALYRGTMVGWRAAITDVKRGRMPRPEAIRRIAVGHIVLPVVFQLVSNGFDWDTKDQLGTLVLGPFAGMIFVRDIIEGISAVAQYGYAAMRPQMSPVFSGLESLLKAIYHSVVKDEPTAEDYFITTQALGSVVGGLTGVPVDPMLRSARGVRRAATGETEHPIMESLGWGPGSLVDDE